MNRTAIPLRGAYVLAEPRALGHTAFGIQPSGRGGRISPVTRARTGSGAPDSCLRRGREGRSATARNAGIHVRTARRPARTGAPGWTMIESWPRLALSL